MPLPRRSSTNARGVRDIRTSLSLHNQGAKPSDDGSARFLEMYVARTELDRVEQEEMLLRDRLQKIRMRANHLRQAINKGLKDAAAARPDDPTNNRPEDGAQGASAKEAPANKPQGRAIRKVSVRY